MSFYKRERILDQIQSEIKKSEAKISRLIKKKDLKDNKFVEEVNKNLVAYQKNIMEEKIHQLEHINILVEYLEKNANKSNQKKIILQQKKLSKIRSKLKEEIQKYLRNI